MSPQFENLMIDFAAHSAEELSGDFDEVVLDRLILSLRNLKILRLAGLNRLESKQPRQAMQRFLYKLINTAKLTSF